RRSAAFWPWSVHPPLGHRSRGSRQLCRENQGQRWYDHFRTWRGRVEIPRARRHGCRNCRGRSLQDESGERARVIRRPSVKRREFITMLLGGAAAAWPFAARAQQTGKLPTIGFLGTTTPSAWSQWVAAFVQRLRDFGWIEGRSIAVEYRWAEGRDERFVEIAAEFVQLKVDVIVTSGTALLAAKQATSPAYVAFAQQPAEIGIVSTLRPEGP